MEAQKGEEYFPMCRKDVNSDLMPIWKPIWKREQLSFYAQGGREFFSVPERCQGWILRLRRPVATSWHQPLVQSEHHDVSDHNNNIKHNKQTP